MSITSLNFDANDPWHCFFKHFVWFLMTLIDSNGVFAKFQQNTSYRQPKVLANFTVWLTNDIPVLSHSLGNWKKAYCPQNEKETIFSLSHANIVSDVLSSFYNRKFITMKGVFPTWGVSLVCVLIPTEFQNTCLFVSLDKRIKWPFTPEQLENLFLTVGFLTKINCYVWYFLSFTSKWSQYKLDVKRKHQLPCFQCMHKRQSLSRTGINN